jgi:hypothetical protein
LHTIKPLGYVRYGDDFVLWCSTETEALEAQVIVSQFLTDELGLQINQMHDRVQPAQHKLAYLGVEIWPSGKRLTPKITKRIDDNLDPYNSSSYYSLIKHHQPSRYHKRFLYKILDTIEQEC